MRTAFHLRKATRWLATAAVLLAGVIAVVSTAAPIGGRVDIGNDNRIKSRFTDLPHVPPLIFTHAGSTGIQAQMLSATAHAIIKLGTDGNIYFAGQEDDGEFGLNNGNTQNTSNNQWQMTDMSIFGGPVSYVAGGYDFTLAVSGPADGYKVYGVGDNDDGVLGDGTWVDKPFWVRSMTSNGTQLSNVVKVVAGREHALALDANGNLWAIGDNDMGQLGVQQLNNLCDPTTNPQGVQLSDYQDANPQDPNHVASVTQCQSSLMRQPTWVPVNVQAMTGVTGPVIDIAAGLDHSAILIKDPGANKYYVYAVGSNNYGEVGAISGYPLSSDGTGFQAVQKWQPFLDQWGNRLDFGPSGKVTAGWYTTLATCKTGEFWGIGRNDYDQLGLYTGTTVNPKPQVVNQTIPAVAGGKSGLYNSFLLGVNGSLYGTGDMQYLPHTGPSTALAWQLLNPGPFTGSFKPPGATAAEYSPENAFAAAVAPTDGVLGHQCNSCYAGYYNLTYTITLAVLVRGQVYLVGNQGILGSTMSAWTPAP